MNRANQRLAEFQGRYHVVHANFAEIGEIAAQKGVQSVRGILADLGVSSLQFDSADRGFSFQREGPLDMRMNREAELTAGEIINHYGEKDLANLIFNYGEEHRSRSIARAIVAARPIHSYKGAGRRGLPGSACARLPENSSRRRAPFRRSGFSSTMSLAACLCSFARRLICSPVGGVWPSSAFIRSKTGSSRKHSVPSVTNVSALLESQRANADRRSCSNC